MDDDESCIHGYLWCPACHGAPTVYVADARKFQLVIIESPFAGDIERNLRYVRACMRDCLQRGEAPYASHALYTQQGVLRDEVAEERKLGMEAGFAYRNAVEKSVVYVDCGISKGMVDGIMDAQAKGRPVQFRKLPGWEG